MSRIGGKLARLVSLAGLVEECVGECGRVGVGLRDEER